MRQTKYFPRRFFSLFFLLAAISIFQLSAFAQTLAATPRTSPVFIDGNLNETAWQNALKIANFQWLQSVAQNRAPAKTEVRVTTDEDAVYFGFRCEEPQMEKLKGAPRPRDGSIFSDDVVEIFLSPTGQTATFYQFALSAANVQADIYLIEGGRIVGQPFDAIWESAVFKGADFWSAEIRIPLSAFSLTESSAFSDTWRVNFARERQPVMELTASSPVKLRFAEPEVFQQISQMPRKKPTTDLRLTNLDAMVSSKAGEGGQGALQLGLSAAPLAAGEYSLSIEDSEGHKFLENRKVSVKPSENTLELGDINFPSFGEKILKATLISKSGVLAAGNYFSTAVAYAPLTVEMTEPFYANCIFPDQKLTQLAGVANFNLPLSDLQNSALQISLRSKSGVLLRTEQRLSAKHSATKIPFALDTAPQAGSTPSLPDGDYNLILALEKGGKTLAQSETRIRKLPKPPGNYSYLDHNLNLITDGIPVFARTWMGNEEFMVTQALKEKMPHPNSPFINMWKVLVPVESARLDPSASESESRKNGLKPSQKVFDAMTTAIENNRNRKDTWFYYLSDEPEGNNISVAYLKQTYDFLKEHDPYHPVIIVSHAPELYTGVADIISPDTYLGPMIDSEGKRSMTTPKYVGRQQRLTLEAGKNKTAPWITPQAFSYSGWLGRLPESDFPTFAEYRVVVYSAIANGAKGVMPFIYSDHFGSIDLREGVPFIFESIAKLEPFLISSEKDIPIKADAPEDGVEVLVKSLNGQVVLIAVNLLDKNVTANFQSDGLNKFKQLVGFRENTKAVLQNGKFQLSFAPYETRILSSQKLDDGMKSVPQLLAEMEKTKVALKKPGNILFGRGKEIEWDFSDTYVFEVASLHTLTDGITDALGWVDRLNKMPSRVEMAFPTFVPKFRSAKIYTSTVEDMEFWIWKAGEWQKVGEVKGNKNPVIDFDFGKQLSTVKIKIVMTKLHPGMTTEMYEIELYD